MAGKKHGTVTSDRATSFMESAVRVQLAIEMRNERVINSCKLQKDES